MTAHAAGRLLLKVLLAVALPWATPAATLPAEGADPAGAVIARHRDFLLNRQQSDSIYLPAPPARDDAQLRKWIADLGPDGRWGDVNYANQSVAAWALSAHLDRVRQMARALVDPASALHGDPALAGAALRALDDWLAHRYHNPNWWWNDIGVPQQMRDILVLLGPRLEGARRDGALAVLHQYKVGGEGANLVWSAGLALHCAALTGDEQLLGEMSARIAGEIRVTAGEGIQSDYSFHQHGARLQSLHYGASYVADTSLLAWELRGTPWAFPKEKAELLARCLLDGMQWMCRGGATVPGPLDRSVSRPGDMRVDLRPIARQLAEVLPERAAEFRAVIARQEGGVPPLTGFRYFQRSDFACYQRPGFSFFLKTISDRTLPAESINGENLKGHLLNDGTGWLLREGSEYGGLPPVWNWEALPGLTHAPGVGDIQRAAFVGSVSNGESGLTAMDYRFPGKDGSGLSARKAWFCHGDAVVCLIANLRVTGKARPARTTLDQCGLRGEVSVCGADGAVTVLPRGEHQLRAARWVWHAGFAYVPLQPGGLSLRLGLASGSWASINQSAPDTPTATRTFLLSLEHPASDSGEGWSGGYAIIPCPDPRTAADAAAKPGWRITRNDADAQALLYADGTVLAAFYGAAEIKSKGTPTLAAGSPCLMLVEGGHRWASDPTNHGATVRLSVSGREEMAQLPPGGASLLLPPLD